MDPRERADRALSRAQARDAAVVTPDNAVSPMDAATTQQIPRSVLADAEVRRIDPDATTVVTDAEIRRQDGRAGADYLGNREPTSQLGDRPPVGPPPPMGRPPLTRRPAGAAPAPVPPRPPAEQSHRPGAAGPAPRQHPPQQQGGQDTGPSVVAEELDGLIPTTMQRTQSDLSRRLEG